MRQNRRSMGYLFLAMAGLAAACAPVANAPDPEQPVCATGEQPKDGGIGGTGKAPPVCEE